MLFGEWQAQMMLEKGQTTEGVRVDKKIVINPLFKGKYGFLLVTKDRQTLVSPVRQRGALPFYGPRIACFGLRG